MTPCTLHIEWFPWHQEPHRPQWPLQPHFIKKLTELDVSISPDTKMTYPSLLMWDGSSKIHFFIDYWHPFSWRLWRTGMLLLTKLKGHRSNFHYSGFPNHPQTKSSLNISICQSQLKRKCLPLDTLFTCWFPANIFNISMQGRRILKNKSPQ